ncbi:MAG: DUF790 family protein [Deltaproteobacteria bacterium]|nr:DUF790 family protein [Deltaproteobacteria bacterium]
MLPPSLLSYTVTRGQIVPHFLVERDHPWLRALLDEYDRFAGRRRCELHERLREPLVAPAPPRKLQPAIHVLDRLWSERTAAAVPPARAREVLFGEATREAGGERAGRERALAAAGRRLGVGPAALLDSLFADLPGQRRLVPPKQPIGPAELAQRTNLAMVCGMLRRAVRVQIEAQGGARALVRLAKLRGLLCTVRQAPREPAAPGPFGGAGASEHRAERLDISGPLALFRRTLVYGRALASLVARAGSCLRFELRAECAIGDPQVGFAPAVGRIGRRGPEPELSTLVVRSGDPIFVARELGRYDSRVEERFARDFARAAPDWDLLREPEAVPAAGTLIFPDFLLRLRRRPERRWLLEVVGYWTPEYVRGKLEKLREAGLPNLILCIDEERACGPEELPVAARLVRYRRRIDPIDVLRIIDPEAGEPWPGSPTSTGPSSTGPPSTEPPPGSDRTDRG